MFFSGLLATFRSLGGFGGGFEGGGGGGAFGAGFAHFFAAAGSDALALGPDCVV